VFNSDPSVEAAGSIIGILPMLLLFLVAQRQLIRGATAGAMR
jgi:ABC-type glycerol-3-phosphate transport system permease component